MFKKILPALLIILFITGAVVYLQNTREEKDVFKPTQTGNFEVSMDGWSGFETSEGNKLSLIEPSTGAEISAFGYEYNVHIKPSDEIKVDTIESNIEVEVAAFVTTFNRSHGSVKFYENKTGTEFQISRTVDITTFIQDFELQYYDQAVEVVFSIIVTIKVSAYDIYNVKRVASAVAPKSISLAWVPPSLEVGIGNGDEEASSGGPETPEITITAEYQEGYDDGYADGWKAGSSDFLSGNSMKYTVKVSIEGTTYDEGYQDGYINGYIDGYNYYKERSFISPEPITPTPLSIWDWQEGGNSSMRTLGLGLIIISAAGLIYIFGKRTFFK